MHTCKPSLLSLAAVGFVKEDILSLITSDDDMIKSPFKIVCAVSVPYLVTSYHSTCILASLTPDPKDRTLSNSPSSTSFFSASLGLSRPLRLDTDNSFLILCNPVKSNILDMSNTSSKKGNRDISSIMRKVRSTGTSPEIALRRALADKGLRFNHNGAEGLPGKPDIVLPEERIAIFIDGNFWHGGQWRKRKLASLEEQFQETPQKDYWVNKIRRNVNRDFGNTLGQEKILTEKSPQPFG
jgi:DNA mismatch endonuclease Vsr